MDGSTKFKKVRKERKARKARATARLLHASKQEALRAPRLDRVDPVSDDFLKTYEWRRVRVQVLDRDGRICASCYTRGSADSPLHVDHIKPRRLFPHLALDLDNLQVLCDACNHGKGNWNWGDYRPKEGVVYDPFDEFMARFGPEKCKGEV